MLHSFGTTESTHCHAFDLSVVMEGVAGYWAIRLYPAAFIHECGTYTFVKHDTRFIHSMDHLHCHMALGRFADRLAWSSKAVEVA
jgi:hypothetical protein